MEVRWHPEAERERLPGAERAAMRTAVLKLETEGDRLPYPHSSSVGGSFRELRPRQGRSPWRALYVRVANNMVILAIGPEAQQDRRGFNRACDLADERLRTIRGD